MRGMKSEINNKSEIVNPKSEITMEVHHHPEIEKKGFKEYILEGLMIFLAVFMGFIAENIRERIVEKNREREYMKEMVANLKYDTIRCNRNIVRNAARMKGIDSLKSEIKKAIGGAIDGNKLYYFTIRYGMGYNPAFFNASAITELRSSGSLRILDNKKLVTGISDYYYRTISSADSYKPIKQLDELNNLRNEFFSWADLDDLVSGVEKIDLVNYGTAYDYNKILRIKPALTLLKTKPEDLQRLYNALGEFEFKVNGYDARLDTVKQSAVPLINAIKKEYNLSGE
jgi:hypothetical protein